MKILHDVLDTPAPMPKLDVTDKICCVIINVDLRGKIDQSGPFKWQIPSINMYQIFTPFQEVGRILCSTDDEINAVKTTLLRHVDLKKIVLLNPTWRLRGDLEEDWKWQERDLGFGNVKSEQNINYYHSLCVRYDVISSFVEIGEMKENKEFSIIFEGSVEEFTKAHDKEKEKIQAIDDRNRALLVPWLGEVEARTKKLIKEEYFEDAVPTMSENNRKLWCNGKMNQAIKEIDMDDLAKKIDNKKEKTKQ